MFRALFIALSESRSLRNFAEQSRIGQRMSHRFVAGMTVEEALEATAATNARGMSVSVDNLGENVTNLEEAKHSAQLYHEMLDAITARKLNANASLKLTHMGLDVDESVAHQMTSDVVGHAAKLNNFIRIDMEGSPYTQKTLDMVYELQRQPGNAGHVGAVIQAYLHRSEKDCQELCAEGIRIRLCKGAYKESAEIAFQDKAEVDANFVKLMKILLRSGVYHGIATHDPKMIEATIAFARAENIPASAFEFQMLYGVRRDLQEQLVRDGWGMRVYIPFGTEWYPYLMRRLAERPANAIFILKNLLRK
ncbi:MAG TPA: proline dehydrogenase family protein [Thermoanaerobaculia bacterium]|jgi:proline dehydrogenase|nr:proline dehydrogenase family protein [Thermoanaerobaculia bacterium]